MGVLRGIGVFVGWLSGSLTGIGAVLYACGFLVSRAQLHLLGLDGVLAYSNQHFIQEGGKFFLFVAGVVTEVVLAAVAALVVVGVVVLLGYLPVRLLRPALLARLQAGGARVGALHARMPWSWRTSVYGGLLVILLFHLLPHLREFNRPLDLSNLLYAGPEAAEGDRAQTLLATWLVRGESLSLRRYFAGLLYLQLEAGAVLLLAWRVTTPLRQRGLLLAPFVVVAALFTAYLPLAYGVLVPEARYNVVSLRLGADRAAPASTLFLLEKTDQEFVLWDPREGRVLWVPRGEVKLAKIGEVRNLFGGDRRPAPAR